ncbi:hypothetical protein [Dietzia sp. 179-F 9C3 NHS]|uniref:hypothetical protein n=1 Tax=Dietzia sp. 179-F 9C3 NHS TaxID=3374295 RepID=UPI0038790A29
MTGPHPSDSSVQRGAESAIVAALSEKLRIPFDAGGALTLSNGARIHLDAVSEDGGAAVEAYARQGRLKGGQLKKIAQDVLKLAMLRQDPDYTDVRAIIAFASDEARQSITGWVQHAADVFGVEFHVVDLDPALRAQLLTTQERQKMVNVPLPEAADDVLLQE